MKEGNLRMTFDGGLRAFRICPALVRTLSSSHRLSEAATRDAAPISARPLVGRQAEEYPRS
jgi:hypothetical protein